MSKEDGKFVVGISQVGLRWVLRQVELHGTEKTSEGSVGRYEVRTEKVLQVFVDGRWTDVPTCQEY